MDLAVINLDPVFFSVADGCPDVLGAVAGCAQGDLRACRVGSRRRWRSWWKWPSCKLAGGILHKRLELQAGLAAGAGGFHMDFPTQPAGPAAGRSDSRPYGSASTALLVAIRTMPTMRIVPTADLSALLRFVGVGVGGLPDLQSQDQGRGWLDTRVVHGFSRLPSLLYGPTARGRRSSSRKRFRTACGCSATCMPVSSFSC